MQGELGTVAITRGMASRPYPYIDSSPVLTIDSLDGSRAQI